MDLRQAQREAIRPTIGSVHWWKIFYEIIIPYVVFFYGEPNPVFISNCSFSRAENKLEG